jgi:Na+/H+-dicarboxylate symporter
MDGTAIYLGLSAIFFAQAYGVELEFYHYILIVFTSTIAAVGAAGYPGGSLVVMTLVLSSIGVPTEGIALLIGVDRILDMFRTTINITSDVAITGFIDKTEGTFNKKLYDTPNELIHDDENYDHVAPLKAVHNPAPKAKPQVIAPYGKPVAKKTATKAAPKTAGKPKKK